MDYIDLLNRNWLSDFTHFLAIAFRTLSVIQNDTEPPARNILLAGTGNQEVIWDKGGIFTKALISGLKGRADFNNDNIIQFEELSNYVRNEVAYEAKT
jgi:hypothetical protein